jgi:DNA-directed RNA polymerase specialized sigma24 family protein
VSTGSITLWLRRLEAEPEPAAQALWERFFARMTALARRRLLGSPRRVADEEDVAADAFARFHRAALAGRFPRLHDRGDLWRILFTLTTRAADDLRRKEGAEKRGGAAVAGDSALGDPADEGPSPEEEAILSEELARLLAALPEEGLRQIALARMQGHTNAEIAQQQACAEVTIERRARLIRAVWQRLAEAGKSDGS